MQDALASSASFAANRARGAVAFDVHVVEGRTRRRQLHESGSLRVRFPSPEDDGLTAMFVNTAGGAAGGDRFDIDIAAGEGTRLTLSTAAAEKIYRSHGPAAEINISLRAEAGSHLSWLPQETILFDQARTARSIDIDLAETASLVLCEIIVFGRTAMGEAMQTGSFVDGDIGAKLAKPAIANGGLAIATALIVPGDEALLERLRAAAEQAGCEVGVSCWNGFAMARICAQDAAQLRADMMALLSQSGAMLPRMWLN
jgi:urease accessory protein